MRLIAIRKQNYLPEAYVSCDVLDSKQIIYKSWQAQSRKLSSLLFRESNRNIDISMNHLTVQEPGISVQQSRSEQHKTLGRHVVEDDTGQTAGTLTCITRKGKKKVTVLWTKSPLCRIHSPVWKHDGWVFVLWQEHVGRIFQSWPTFVWFMVTVLAAVSVEQYSQLFVCLCWCAVFVFDWNRRRKHKMLEVCIFLCSAGLHTIPHAVEEKETVEVNKEGGK